MNRLHQYSARLSRALPPNVDYSSQLPERTPGQKIKSGFLRERPVGDLCLEIAKFAQDRDCRTLDYLMKTAAEEAYDSLDQGFSIAAAAETVGVWDWDVPSDILHACRDSAALFGLDEQKALRGGIRFDAIAMRIHPDDVCDLAIAMNQALNHGGRYEANYRIIVNDTVRWVYAKGVCFLDSAGMPSRFPGVVFDITSVMERKTGF